MNPSAIEVKPQTIRLLLPSVLPAILLTAALWIAPGSASGQIFELDANGNLSTYNASTGAVITSSLVSSPNSAQFNEFALSGSSLYMGSVSGATVSTYNATTGAVANANFVTTTNGGINFDPVSVAVSGSANTLFVLNDAGTIGSFNATTGAAIKASLVSGLEQPVAIAVSGNTLYVADYNAAGSSTVGFEIGEYNATTGAATSADFISFGINSNDYPVAMALAGGNLYVSYNYRYGPGNTTSNGYVDAYNATTGAIVQSQLVSIVNNGYLGGLGITGNSLYVS